jgi:hypothetical protein
MPYADRATKRTYDLQRYHRLRAEYFAGKRCAICGGDDGLELHHLDPDAKESHRIWSWSLRRREAELAKCTTLCRWCHRDLHAEALRKPQRHGITSAYRRGCRCDVCKAHHAARLRSYRRRKAAQEVTV